MSVSKVYVDSSVIDCVQHDRDEDSVLVHFVNGSNARYYDVNQQDFLDFVSADSPGRYYNNVIKQKPTRPVRTLQPGDRVRLKATTVNGTAKVVRSDNNYVVVELAVDKGSVEKV